MLHKQVLDTQTLDSGVTWANSSETMDHTLLHWLRSAEGTAILAELAERELRESDILAEITRLRRQLPAERARAAVEQALLRRKAAAKFPYADRMFFTRDALEQASAALVAAHRARRLARTSLVADLGCGIGSDTIALALAGTQVIAVDRDPVRLALAQANVEALGLAGQVTFCERDLLMHRHHQPKPSSVIRHAGSASAAFLTPTPISRHYPTS